MKQINWKEFFGDVWEVTKRLLVVVVVFVAGYAILYGIFQFLAWVAPLGMKGLEAFVKGISLKKLISVISLLYVGAIIGRTTKK